MKFVPWYFFYNNFYMVFLHGNHWVRHYHLSTTVGCKHVLKYDMISSPRAPKKSKQGYSNSVRYPWLHAQPEQLSPLVTEDCHIGTEREKHWCWAALLSVQRHTHTERERERESERESAENSVCTVTESALESGWWVWFNRRLQATGRSGGPPSSLSAQLHRDRVTVNIRCIIPSLSSGMD